ncbi:MAG: EAL domain-containing protein [Candidatus Competibacter sp.]|nr:EAL domain-containing protein [Candidatus Competibacter sp.]MDG4583213.1 EAL domain-containing protein [Candidatus Competibacter sp.]
MNVLIVDDNQDGRVLLRGLLESRGYRVEEAANGLQAFDRVRAEPPELIVSDILMPEMDGFALCRIIKSIEKLKHIPFVFYTATYLNQHDEELGLWLGACRYIRKPQEPKQLLETIDRVIAESRDGALPVRQPPKGFETVLEAMYRDRLTEKLDKKSQDVERLRREQALILASASEGIVGMNLEGKHTVVNAAAARMLGYEIEEMIGRHSHSLWHHSHADGSPFPVEDCPIHACMRDGQTRHQMEEVFWRKDGGGLPVEYSSSPLLENGAVRGVVVMFRDITERQQAKERQRLATSVFDNTAEGIVITDASGTVVEVNRAFTEILGYTREDAIGRIPKLWKSGHHEASFYRDLWRSLAETGQWRGEIWNRRKDGSVFPEWLAISAVTDGNGCLTHYVGVFSDISGIKHSQEQLHHLAHHDALTDLPNRLLLNERLEQAIKRAERHATHLAVFFLDLDYFKHINDSLGHPAGDRLLKNVAERLSDSLRREDTVARAGGDEFVLLLEDVGEPEKAAVAARKLIASLTDPFDLENRRIAISASVGIALYPQDGTDPATLLRNADAAMYRAKEEGRNTYRFYTEELTRNAFERVSLENDLRQAIAGNELLLFYQPQIDLHSQRIIGVEALIRWRHPQLGMVSPIKFIPLAEECGLIHPIGDWVLRTACLQGKAWLERSIEFGQIAVNLAGPQIQRGGLADTLETVLTDTGFPAARLELEVTEGFIMRQAEAGIRELESIRRLGATLAIDDFGTGYSSLSYLKRLPIQKIKIDQSFVRDLPADPNDAAIANAVIALGKSMNLLVIAEGVETQEQADFLKKAGCQEAQGYLYSRPIDAEEIEALFSRKND